MCKQKQHTKNNNTHITIENVYPTNTCISVDVNFDFFKAKNVVSKSIWMFVKTNQRSFDDKECIVIMCQVSTSYR